MSYSPLMKACFGRFNPPHSAPEIGAPRSPIISSLSVPAMSSIDLEEIDVESSIDAEDQKEKKSLFDYLTSFQMRLQNRFQKEEEFALRRPEKKGRVIYVEPKEIFMAACNGPSSLEKFFNRGEKGYVMIKKPRTGLSQRPILVEALKINMDLESLKLLIQYSDKKNQFVNRGSKTTPLRVALELRRIEIIPYLLYHGAEIVPGLLGEDDKDSAQDLFFNAVEDGDLKLVKFFHQCGFPLNSTDEEENFNTALHLAAAGDHPMIVSYLIRKGADRTAKNKNGHDYLQHAESEFKNVFDEILNFLKKEESLKHFESGSKKYLNALMNVKDINGVVDDLGNSLFHLLMQKGFMNCELRVLIVHLIERGADLSQINLEGKTPVDLAQECIQKEKEFVLAYRNSLQDVIEAENLLVEIRHSCLLPDETPKAKNSRAFANVQNWIATKTPHLILDSIKNLTQPNQRIDEYGNTLLHSLVESLFDPEKQFSVSYFRILQVMTELVKQGASPFMMNNEGISALDLGRDLLSKTRNKSMYKTNCQLIESLEELERSQIKASDALQVSEIVFSDSI